MGGCQRSSYWVFLPFPMLVVEHRLGWAAQEATIVDFLFSEGFRLDFDRFQSAAPGGSGVRSPLESSGEFWGRLPGKGVCSGGRQPPIPIYKSASGRLTSPIPGGARLRWCLCDRTCNDGIPIICAI